MLWGPSADEQSNILGPGMAWSQGKWGSEWIPLCLHLPSHAAAALHLHLHLHLHSDVGRSFDEFGQGWLQYSTRYVQYY